MFKKINSSPNILTKDDLFKIIDANTEIVVIAPWNGAPVPVTIKMLDSVALSSCGEFNTVSFIVQDVQKDPDLEEIIKTKNIHESMVKLSLVHPTYEELEEHLFEKDFYIEKKKQISEINTAISKLKSEVEKEKLRNKLYILELSIAFILPEDFTTYIVTILMQRQATDLNKLTKETLLQAGFLGEKYNVRPSEYLKGAFTDKQKMDIDVTALMLVNDYREAQKIEKGGMKWIRGKGKK